MLSGRGANVFLPQCIGYTHTRTHARAEPDRALPGGSAAPRQRSASSAQRAPTTMEVLESGEQSVLQWDRKLSELSEPGDTEALMYHTVRLGGAGRAA